MRLRLLAVRVHVRRSRTQFLPELRSEDGGLMLVDEDSRTKFLPELRSEGGGLMPMDEERYPKNWLKITLGVKQAAGWKCEECGRQCRGPGDPFDTHKPTLIVHHKDHVPENWDPSNLIALCAPCHLRADARHSAETRRVSGNAKSGADARKDAETGRSGCESRERGEIMAADEKHNAVSSPAHYAGDGIECKDAMRASTRRTPPVLDPCCGSRMFYFDKTSPSVLFCDRREEETEVLCDGRTLTVKPDLVADVADLPFKDGSFPLVVFDPPHLFAGSTGWQAKKYGTLPANWRAWMARAFSECWRVLSEDGTLVFKWCEYHVKLSDVLECAPSKPLFGNRRPYSSKTHWLVFFKPTDGGADV
ncbi:hypothetical protein GMI70_02920 [Eggerthellaceae bacterium zg-893]|nr:hypothetical protein [Eggerthellaceae bacterium zg-893]